MDLLNGYHKPFEAKQRNEGFEKYICIMMCFDAIEYPSFIRWPSKQIEFSIHNTFARKIDIESYYV